MNEIKIIVKFKEHECYFEDEKDIKSLISGDYNSTKLVFDFDIEDGTKVFEMKNENNEIVYAGEINNNELILVGKDENDNNCTLFNTKGTYAFEITLYGNDSKLTSAHGAFSVQQEEVVISDDVAESHLPIFDEMINNLDDALDEVETIDIDVEKVDSTTTVTLIKKDGTTKEVEILDGVDGINGQDGANGQDGRDGTDGQDGITPTIGNNGNWYLGETDTGKPSRGIQGENGQDGQDGQNGQDGYTPIKGVDYFTSEDIASLNIPTNLSDLTDDTTHRLVSDSEKSTWNSKSDFSGNYNDLTNKPTKLSEFTDDLGSNPTHTHSQYLTSHQDISMKQDITDNTLNTNNKTVPSAINEVNSIAKGANQALSYSNYQAMITAFNSLANNVHNVGQNVMIITLNVPDLWISSIESTSQSYTYTSDSDFTNALATNGYVQVGYYKLSALETQKVDLTNYVTNTDYVESGKAGIIRLSSGLGASNGYVYLTVYSYENYNNATNGLFIGKGTLENVITGKNLETGNNKVTTISSSSTNAQYPSAKCVYDYIQSLDGDEVSY